MMIRVKFLENVQPGYVSGQPYDLEDSFAHLMVSTRKASYVTASAPASQGRTVMSGGLRVAFIGASTEIRAHPMWQVPAASYSRTNGTATAVLDFTLKDQFFLPGHRVRFACDARADVEGSFEILTSTTSAGVSTTITYADSRPDVAAGALGATGFVHDLHGWTITSGFPAFANLGFGGGLDMVVIATGSTNVIRDWDDTRLRQVVDQGPFDAIVIGTGILGNAIKGYGAGANATYQGVVQLIGRLRRLCNPRLILVETLPLSRDVTPTDPTFTAASRLNALLWNQLQRDCTDVAVIPCGEALVQNYCAYNAAPSADVSNGWPEQNALIGDGVHFAFAGSRMRGLVMADTLLRTMGRIVSPEMGMLPATRQVATAADPEGNFHPNQALGFWGNVDSSKATLAGTGISGVGPAGASVTFEAGRGASTAVGALRTNPSGGTDWVVTIAGAGSASGYTTAIELAPAWLLTALNSAANQGRYVDVILPLTLQLNALKILWASIELAATVGGTEYILGAAQAAQGLFTMASQGRAMDAGYSGLMRFPRFRIPVAAYTAARFRVRVKEINGSVASGQTVVVMGPGQVFQVLEG
jgi:hypothetical protein